MVSREKRWCQGARSARSTLRQILVTMVVSQPPRLATCGAAGTAGAPGEGASGTDAAGGAATGEGAAPDGAVAVGAGPVGAGPVAAGDTGGALDQMMWRLVRQVKSWSA